MWPISSLTFGSVSSGWAITSNLGLAVLVGTRPDLALMSADRLGV